MTITVRISSNARLPTLERNATIAIWPLDIASERHPVRLTSNSPELRSTANVHASCRSSTVQSRGPIGPDRNFGTGYIRPVRRGPAGTERAPVDMRPRRNDSLGAEFPGGRHCLRWGPRAPPQLTPAAMPRRRSTSSRFLNYLSGLTDAPRAG